MPLEHIPERFCPVGPAHIKQRAARLCAKAGVDDTDRAVLNILIDATPTYAWSSPHVHPACLYSMPLLEHKTGRPAADLRASLNRLARAGLVTKTVHAGLSCIGLSALPRPGVYGLRPSACANY